MGLAQLVGSLGVGSCDMLTSGGAFVCACLMALLRITIAADRAVRMASSCAMIVIEIIARLLNLESGVARVLMGKIGIIFHVLGNAFVINISAAMICTMARFLQLTNRHTRSWRQKGNACVQLRFPGGCQSYQQHEPMNYPEIAR